MIFYVSSPERRAENGQRKASTKSNETRRLRLNGSLKTEGKRSLKTIQGRREGKTVDSERVSAVSEARNRASASERREEARRLKIMD